ncbi:hypothetical protein ACFOUP_09595 [Belliella kenyensis]|uniref:PorV/PorQ family protein n=1 Tax=Belliella kenyensis TaxID=1472724 RepID=A0ABV8ENS4_9BACT|nr:hypothetical protein [Belliella kenyensis]MCH7402962.1 hypothetical protein [Belliella kenyensis]MDN3604998.1 hypothetical protein [Belliella kenyensis]
MKVFVVFLINICLPILSQAQGGLDIKAKGARSMGMANASSTLSDTWSPLNNIASIAYLQSSSIAVGYDHRFQMDELTTLSASAVFYTQKFNFGISTSSYGDDYFNQQHIGIGIANRLGIASLGLKVNLLQTNIEGFGRAISPVFEFGGLAELTPMLWFAGHIYNITYSKFSKASADHLPTVVKSSLSYRPSDKLMLNIEAEKDILLPADLKLGLEYNLLDKVWMRSGFHIIPGNLFFGLGFKPKRFVIDYALGQQKYLGPTHHFSVGYNFSDP